MPLATPQSLPMFLKEVVEEIRDQQKAEPTNKNLVQRMRNQAALLHKALIAKDSPDQIVQEAVQLAAYAARVATEGDPEFRHYRWPYE